LFIAEIFTIDTKAAQLFAALFRGFRGWYVFLLVGIERCESVRGFVSRLSRLATFHFINGFGFFVGA
jgi:hypothetical protein